MRNMTSGNTGSFQDGSHPLGVSLFQSCSSARQSRTARSPTSTPTFSLTSSGVLDGETPLDIKGGTGTISAYLSNRACIDSGDYYRPYFQFKYFQSKPGANGWVYGWSYGNWYGGNVKPCVTTVAM